MGEYIQRVKDRVRMQVQKREAWKSLRRTSSVAVSAMELGFRKANQYYEWDAWALDPISIMWIANLVIERQIHRIIEFGSGYSTIALSEFFMSVGHQVHLDTFEHQLEYAERIQKYLPDDESLVRLHRADLLQIDDDLFEQLFEIPDPCGAFLSSAVPVPKERYHETRLRNVFYGFDFDIWKGADIELIILDGPNGNGRSMAFPFLKHCLRTPSWVLIDDYQDYPFLDYLQKTFTTHTVNHSEIKNKEFVLVEIIGLK